MMRGRVRPPPSWLALAAICCLSMLEVTLSNREEVEILVSSGFDHSRPQGWAVHGKGNPSLVMEAGGRLARVLVARGHGGKSNGWGFVAPPEYLGDQGVAYGGRIEFTLRRVVVGNGTARHILQHSLSSCAVRHLPLAWSSLCAHTIADPISGG